MTDHLPRRIFAHAVSAMVIGLCAALPATGATFLIALGASCISSAGCQTPTVIDALVPVAAVTVWAATTVVVAARNIRALLVGSDDKSTVTQHLSQHCTPRGIPS